MIEHLLIKNWTTILGTIIGALLMYFFVYMPEIEKANKLAISAEKKAKALEDGYKLLVEKQKKDRETQVEIQRKLNAINIWHNSSSN